MSRILLVDDESEVRDELRAALVAMGHHVSEAAGGRDGCLLAEREPFDCAVVDMFMPEMDGIETVQVLKSLCPELPVVVMAGEGRVNADFACRAALALGADHALRKPVDARALEALLPSVDSSAAC